MVFVGGESKNNFYVTVTENYPDASNGVPTLLFYNTTSKAWQTYTNDCGAPDSTSVSGTTTIYLCHFTMFSWAYGPDSGSSTGNLVTGNGGNSNSRKLSGGQIAGIVIGCVAFFLLLLLIVLFIYKRSRRGSLFEPDAAPRDNNDYGLTTPVGHGQEHGLTTPEGHRA